MSKEMPGQSQSCESEIGAKPGDPDFANKKADELHTTDDSQSVAEKAARQAK